MVTRSMHPLPMSAYRILDRFVCAILPIEGAVFLQYTLQGGAPGSAKSEGWKVSMVSEIGMYGRHPRFILYAFHI